MKVLHPDVCLILIEFDAQMNQEQLEKVTEKKSVQKQTEICKLKHVTMPL